MLGKREPELYGSATLASINQGLEKKASGLGLDLLFFQSNHEGAIVDEIHRLFDAGTNGIIINPGAFTHTSVAIRDALLLLLCPIIEIHLSSSYKREPVRHKSLVADIAIGQISGFGHYGYQMALNAMADKINEA